MLDRITECIGRGVGSIMSTIFNTVNDFKIEKSMVNDQLEASKATIRSNLNVGISMDGYTNFFKNRVVGEFLKVVSVFISPVYSEEENAYVAYFVRKKSKYVIEYITFKKSNKENTEYDIFFTYFNKGISSNGVTYFCGNTSKNVLNVPSALSLSVFDALDPKKAPYFVVYENPVKAKYVVSNEFFMNDCLNYMMKAASLSATKQNSKLERLFERAGIHLFMSFFSSYETSLYARYYRKQTKNKDMISGIALYNSLHFNVNKVISFKFDSEYFGNSPTITFNSDCTESTLMAYGVTITFTGKIQTNDYEHFFKRMNYKFADAIVKSGDSNLVYNFLLFVSTCGGVDISELRNEIKSVSVNVNSVDDQFMTDMNEKVEAEVDTAMVVSKFVEDKHGEFTSDYHKQTSEMITESVADAKEPHIQLIQEAVTTAVKPTTIVEKKDNSDYSAIETLKMASSSSSEVRYISEMTDKPLASWTLDECIKALSGDYMFDVDFTRHDVKLRIQYLESKNG